MTMLENSITALRGPLDQENIANLFNNEMLALDQMKAADPFSDIMLALDQVKAADPFSDVSVDAVVVRSDEERDPEKMNCADEENGLDLQHRRTVGAQLDLRRNIEESQSPEISHAPPERAERILYFLLPKDKRQYLIGDLEEEYRTVILPKYGYQDAAKWYSFQVVREVAAVFGERIRIWLGISAVASAIGWVVGKLGS